MTSRAQVYERTVGADGTIYALGGDGSSWNARFLQALDAAGLMLSQGEPLSDKNLYPNDGSPMLAPRPYGDGASFGEEWPLQTYIVWKPDL